MNVRCFLDCVHGVCESMEGHTDNKLYIVAVWFIVNPLLNKYYYYYHYYLYSVQIFILSKSCISLEQPLT